MSLERIADVLRGGGVAVIPTDTVYGIAALPELRDAVGTIFRLKGRPADKPLPVLGASVASLAAVAVLDERAQRLAEHYWPGPLTIVVRRAANFDADLGGTNDNTVAVRVPESRLALELLGLTGPLAVTSANLSGAPPCADAASARELWPDVPVLDDGPAGGEPSTVLSLIGAPEVLRAGALDAHELLAFCD